MRSLIRIAIAASLVAAFAIGCSGSTGGGSSYQKSGPKPAKSAGAGSPDPGPPPPIVRP
jgi:hypothetical protein